MSSPCSSTYHLRRCSPAEPSEMPLRPRYDVVITPIISMKGAVCFFFPAVDRLTLRSYNEIMDRGLEELEEGI